MAEGRQRAARAPQILAALAIALALWAAARAREPGQIFVPLGAFPDGPRSSTTIGAVLEGPVGALFVARVRPPTLRAGVGPGAEVDDVLVPAGVRVRRLVSARHAEFATPRE